MKRRWSLLTCVEVPNYGVICQEAWRQNRTAMWPIRATGGGSLAPPASQRRHSMSWITFSLGRALLQLPLSAALPRRWRASGHQALGHGCRGKR